MEVNSDTSVMFETENEDDTFYAEIKRQILLLTSEDNEDLIESKSFNSIDVANDGLNKSISSFDCETRTQKRNFYLWEAESVGSPPIWLVNLWKNGKGTGVFIPQVTCREKQRPGTISLSTSLAETI